MALFRPSLGGQIFDLVVRHRGQASEHVPEVFPRVELPAPAGFDDRVNDRAALPRLVRCHLNAFMSAGEDFADFALGGDGSMEGLSR